MYKPNLMVVYGGGTIGGAEEYLYLLMKNLTYERFGKIIFVSLGDAPLVSRVKKLPIEVRVLPYSHLSPLRVLRELKETISEHKVSVLNTHGLRSNTYGRKAATDLAIPVVTTVHSVLKFDYPNPIKRIVAQSMEKMTRPLTQKFIAVSHAVKEDLINYGVSPKKVEVIHNGVDLERFKPLNEQETSRIRKSYDIKPNELVIGIVARLQPVKGHQYFLQAAKEIAEQFPTVKFLVVGDGPLRGELEERVKDLELQNRVVFTGFQEEVEKLIGIMDIFCLSSLMEGFGLAPVEAMALRKPVVATAVGGIKEIIINDEIGLLAQPADSRDLANKLLSLIKNKELALTIAEKGQKYVQQNYDFMKTVKKVEDAFIECQRNEV